jgi:hypothetical protein
MSLNTHRLEVLNESLEGLIVGESYAPVGGRIPEPIASPVRVEAHGTVAQGHPGDVADAIVVVRFGRWRDADVPKLTVRLKLLGPGPAKVAVLQPAMLSGSQDFSRLGD